MASMLIAIIYLAFISLGLPDSMLGAGWPVMRVSFGVPLSYAGIISVVIAAGSVVSSLLSERMARRFGSGLVTAVSVGMTCAAMFGFSASHSFWALCAFALPYGFGAGGVDAALNHYVALHYASRHMNWLHCFWGVGAAISPNIMGYCLLSGAGWSGGYRAVAFIQLGLTAALFLSLPLWKKQPRAEAAQTAKQGRVFGIRGVKYVIVAFFCYCALESTAGLWTSSYLEAARGVPAETAAQYASLFFIGITAGRFLCGFVSDRLGDRMMIRLGGGVMVLGILSLFVPIDADWLSLYGFVVLGLGCAPIFPAIIHATPANFGEAHSQAIIGVQMAGAYVGATLTPPAFGALADAVGVWVFPGVLLALAALMIVMSERLNRAVGGEGRV